jgi:hypothetical protein
MVWRFPDQQDRDAVCRAVSRRGYGCYGTGQGQIDKAFLLTVTESTDPRRLEAAQIIRRLAHNRISPPVLGPPRLPPSGVTPIPG